jgi:hypothetical protein
MNDITKHYRFQRILQEAAQFRTLRRMLDAAHGPSKICDGGHSRREIQILPAEWETIQIAATAH